MNLIHRSDPILGALAQVLVPLVILLVTIAYLYARYHAWEMLRHWSWVRGIASARILNGKQEVNSPCDSWGLGLFHDDEMKSIVLCGAAKLLGPRVLSVAFSVPGQQNLHVSYLVQSTDRGVEIVFPNPLTKPSCIADMGAPSLIVTLKNRWTRRTKILGFIWKDPVPEVSRWAFLEHC